MKYIQIILSLGIVAFGMIQHIRGDSCSWFSWLGFCIIL